MEIGNVGTLSRMILQWSGNEMETEWMETERKPEINRIKNENSFWKKYASVAIMTSRARIFDENSPRDSLK